MARAIDVIDNIEVYDEELHIDLWYANIEDTEIKSLVIGLMDVRATDGIKVEYDFARDGWVIKQASKFGWSGDDSVCDPDWQEVAFIQSWARETPYDPVNDKYLPVGSEDPLMT